MDYTELSSEDLHDELKNRGLSSTGNKNDMVKRLEENDAVAVAAAAAVVVPSDDADAERPAGADFNYGAPPAGGPLR